MLTSTHKETEREAERGSSSLLPTVITEETSLTTSHNPHECEETPTLTATHTQAHTAESAAPKRMLHISSLSDLFAHTHSHSNINSNINSNTNSNTSNYNSNTNTNSNNGDVVPPISPSGPGRAHTHIPTHPHTPTHMNALARSRTQSLSRSFSLSRSLSRSSSSFRAIAIDNIMRENSPTYIATLPHTERQQREGEREGEELPPLPPPRCVSPSDEHVSAYNPRDLLIHRMKSLSSASMSMSMSRSFSQDRERGRAMPFLVPDRVQASCVSPFGHEGEGEEEEEEALLVEDLSDLHL